MRLERCSRLLPHDQNTGGFFVALLRKHAPLGAQEQEKSHARAPPEKRQEKEKEKEKESEREKAGKMASGAKKGKKLARSGPAAGRLLPQLAAEELCLPLPTGCEHTPLSAHLLCACLDIYLVYIYIYILIYA
jgi:hypothetical protein